MLTSSALQSSDTLKIRKHWRPSPVEPTTVLESGMDFLRGMRGRRYNTSYDSRQLPDISCTEVHASCLHVRIAENTTRVHPVSRVTLANRGHLAWTLFTTSSKLRLHQMSPWIPMNRAVAVLIRTSTQKCITIAWT